MHATTAHIQKEIPWQWLGIFRMYDICVPRVLPITLRTDGGTDGEA